MSVKKSLRWAFDLRKWDPITESQWKRAMRCLTVEERTSVRRYRYRDDAKAALVGRLLAHLANKECRKFGEKFGGNEELMRNLTILRRGNSSGEGRPFLGFFNETQKKSSAVEWADFNVSHEGCFVVLAAEFRRPKEGHNRMRRLVGGLHGPRGVVSTDLVVGLGRVEKGFNKGQKGQDLDDGRVVRVGIDVMNLNRRPMTRNSSSSSLCPAENNEEEEKEEKFFRLMERQFTPREWVQIRRGGLVSGENGTKMAGFMRLWTLKESFVKADGAGLKWDLRRLNFEVNDPLHENQQDPVTSTWVEIDGEKATGNWVFEESLLDADHTVTVATNVEENLDHTVSSEGKENLNHTVAVARNVEENLDHTVNESFDNAVDKSGGKILQGNSFKHFCDFEAEILGEVEDGRKFQEFCDKHSNEDVEEWKIFTNMERRKPISIG